MSSSITSKLIFDEGCTIRLCINQCFGNIGSNYMFFWWMMAPVNVYLYGKKWSGRILQFKFNYITSDKHNFGVYMDVYLILYTCRTNISLQAWNVIEQRCRRFFFKNKNIAKKMFFYSGLTLGWYCWPIRSPNRFWLTAHHIPLEPLGASGLANVPHKCTLIRFFCKVNNISN